MGGMAAETVDEYIAGFPDEVRGILERVRTIVTEAVPGGEERISYGMPAVMLGGRYAIHFAGWKKHLGLYPVPPLPAELEARVGPYRSGEDSVNLVYAEPIPYDLIAEIVTAIVELRRS